MTDNRTAVTDDLVLSLRRISNLMTSVTDNIFWAMSWLRLLVSGLSLQGLGIVSSPSV
jgi:hypothetical protein